MMPTDPTVSATRGAAITYSARGLAVFPVHSQAPDGRCSCGRPPGDSHKDAFKHPATEHGHNDATTDLDVIDKWWQDKPDANIGIATGHKSRLWVLDLDGPDAQQWWAGLATDHGGEPDTFTVSTPRGRHLYFTTDRNDLKSTTSKLAPGVDTRAEGGYVVAAPSTRSDGAYVAEDGPDRPASMPAWLDQLAPAKGDVKPREPYTGPTAPMADVAHRYQAALDHLGAAANATRNNTLNNVAWRIGTMVGAAEVTRARAEADLTTTALAIGLEPDEIASTVASGLDAGTADPAATTPSVPDVTVLDQGGHGPSDDTVRLVDGGSFVFDTPDRTPAVWGSEGRVLWAEGEGLILFGNEGVGKTTLALQVVRARLGLADDVLGFPVADDGRRVLYLAMDRPSQIARAMARLFAPDDRDTLTQRLAVWRGPLPALIESDPAQMVRLARHADAGTVIVDSLKDLTPSIEKPDSSALVNRAMQDLVANGVQVLALHHPRKSDGKGQRVGLDELYGGRWLAAGAGSVFQIVGQGGDERVAVHHVKQPSESVGPLDVIHDHRHGTSTADRPPTPFEVVQSHDGATAADVAGVCWGKDDKAAKQRARRVLDGLESDGLVTHHERSTDGGGSPVKVYVEVAA